MVAHDGVRSAGVVYTIRGGGAMGDGASPVVLVANAPDWEQEQVRMIPFEQEYSLFMERLHQDQVARDKLAEAAGRAPLEVPKECTYEDPALVEECLKTRQ